MKAQPSKGVNSRQWKPLSIEQENCIDRLLLGDTDEEAAAAVGVVRQTVWQWRNTHPYFQICLERRRADLYRASFERLRALLGKAVENIAGAIEEGSVPLSVELLKIVGLHGDGGSIKKDAGLVTALDDPRYVLGQMVEQRMHYTEGIPENSTNALLIDMTKSHAYTQRQDEIRAELEAEYLEPSE